MIACNIRFGLAYKSSSESVRSAIVHLLTSRAQRAQWCTLFRSAKRDRQSSNERASDFEKVYNRFQILVYLTGLAMSGGNRSCIVKVKLRKTQL